MSDSHRPKHPFKPRFGAEGTCVYCYELEDSPFHVIRKVPEADNPEQRAYRYEVVRKLAEKLYLMDVYGAHPEFDDADQLLQNTYVGKARALIADPDLKVELR